MHKATDIITSPIAVLLFHTRDTNTSTNIGTNTSTNTSTDTGASKPAIKVAFMQINNIAIRWKCTFAAIYVQVVLVVVQGIVGLLACGTMGANLTI